MLIWCCGLLSSEEGEAEEEEEEEEEEGNARRQHIYVCSTRAAHIMRWPRLRMEECLEDLQTMQCTSTKAVLFPAEPR